ncbi:MAG: helix-turn-helix transcriptional regulator [Lentisphaerae bacterium]|jgi:transcriptional regulator with XRE-family HTH domain|nr:helix-turn-helix transcriptional regulator [Lentisphaerota bacterium]MBT5606420.1 helix-turn-helix transcriptional regulator [Lentisphaerota bacterium]MBT7057232.1 helix-turn-helix transcriptional regulator [Lentisphaerota bacterium]MBT7843523.1 helix-turn-helix transcriptional regulator [Lentisphaerota bacterium]
MNTRELGTTVTERRKCLGLDQRSLAEIAGVSVHALSDIESGKANPTLRIVSAVADSLGMEIRLEVRSQPVRREGS